MAQQTIDLHVNPSDEAIRLGPLMVRFLITGENSTGTLAAFELVVPAAQRLAAPAHSHDHYEETIYGIEGALTWTVDGKQIDVGPGQALCIPRGAIHRFDNHGTQDVKALCVITPAAIGPQYFREAAEVIHEAYIWALIAAFLSLWAAMSRDSSGIWGASRHALTVGFLAMMVFAIGQRVLPAFSGMRLLFSTKLMFCSLLLLAVGCLLRVSSEVLAYQGMARAAWSWLPVSAICEMAAVTVFAFNLLITFACQAPAIAAQPLREPG